MKRVGQVVAALVALGGLLFAGFIAWSEGIGPIPSRQHCTATVANHTVRLSADQAENASLIAAVGVRRGLPARAVSIALATAYQESKLVNIDYGDRDSVGLFQQRPSQGWGTVEEIMDPYYSTNAFYDGLEEVDGYERMRITEAAQLVQRSGFPEAYEDHAEDARALASALTGYSPGGVFTCVHRTSADEASLELNERGLTERAEAVRADLLRTFGDVSLGGFEPGGVSTGHMPGSAHYEGRAVDVFVRPINEATNRQGWAIAQYLVAHADRLAIEHVIFDAKIWSNGLRSEQGWRDYDVDADRPGDRDILLHRDHVHVDVAA